MFLFTLLNITFHSFEHSSLSVSGVQASSFGKSKHSSSPIFPLPLPLPLPLPITHSDCSLSHAPIFDPISPLPFNSFTSYTSESSISTSIQSDSFFSPKDIQISVSLHGSRNTLNFPLFFNNIHPMLKQGIYKPKAFLEVKILPESSYVQEALKILE